MSSGAARRRRSPGALWLAGAATLLLAAVVALAALAGAFRNGAKSVQPKGSDEVGTKAALGSTTRPTPPPTGRPVVVSLGLHSTGAPVPANFLGLSFEAAAVPWLAGYAQGSNLITLLRAVGPGVMRIGGLSADKLVSFAPTGSPAPAWASAVISREDLAGLAKLARATGWKVLLTLNVAHYSPAAAAQEAALAKAMLGANLLGVEIGNEPDRYVLEGLRTTGWDFSAYQRQYGAYSRAISSAAPGLVLAAPDASSGITVLPWVRQTAADLHPALLTDHYYPLTSCGGSHPSAEELLSAAVQRREDAVLSDLTRLARRAAVPVRVDETNDVSCHGEPGVSNSFASALWAVDWTVRAMESGVAGLNFHDLLAEPSAYSPLVLTNAGSGQAGGGGAGSSAKATSAGSTAASAEGNVAREQTDARTGHPVPPQPLHANPEWYALLLTAGLAGATPVQANVRGAPALHAHAFVTPSGAVRLVLVDLEPPEARPLLVHLHLAGRFAAGSILRLTAPSTAALHGVRLGGAEVDASGAWQPRMPLPRVYGAPGSLSLQIQPASAALVTLTREPASTRTPG